ncbi:MAG: CheA signal transduction histidine kinase [candidate division CPR2 bacterium GW2011_GWD2_39_7]|nr:MAG: CheA signal transduction histidine kinase [candidate division CPR2 bacterium GW2011_GWD2_39_7]
MTSYKTVVLIRRDEDMVGCLVDKIVAEEEILVKPLGPLLKQTTYFSGVTILADGSAAPIINYEGMKWKQSHN